MSGRFLILFLLLFSGLWHTASGQNAARLLRIALQSDTLYLDSLPVVPGSLSVDGYRDSGNYLLLHHPERLVWSGNDRPDSILISYRVPSINPNLIIERKNRNLIEDYFRENPYSYVPSRSSTQTFDPGGKLQTIGNISRGIGFGNNQDVVVNSNLNLRMAGELSDGLNIRAVISDENNPIQPEGNTQQLQDFDRVFIQLYKDSSQLTMGDFLMQSEPQSHFLKYYKRSRGLQYEQYMPQKEGSVLSVRAEAAISRGRFSRNVIEGEEGNQGPYRLSGTNGEVFIIIISGTESIYLDGELLLRGEQNDYTIDYNSGEITFTPKRMITRYTRIVAEFQYSDRNYARSVIQTGASWQKKSWSFNAGIFSEQDHKNQNFQQSLDGFDSLSGLSAADVLSGAGDNINEAFIPRIRQLNQFDVSRVMYRREITPLNDTIYVYTENPEEDTVFYDLVFSLVGEGRGSYRQKTQSTANGRVFEWVGEGVGDYLPVEQLISPKKQQMISFNAIRRYGIDNLISLEWSGSINDLNTFSQRDNNDNFGQGTNLYWLHQDRFRSRKDSSKVWNTTSKLNMEWVDQNFRFVERYRDVEFDRIWNRRLQNPDQSNLREFNREQVLNFYNSIERNKQFLFSNELGAYRKGSGFEGWRNLSKMNWTYKRNQIRSSAEWMQTDQNTSTGALNNRFYRMHAAYGRNWQRISSGADFARENNAYSLLKDSLLANSYRFDQYRTWFQWRDTGAWQWSAEADRRIDYLPESGDYKPSTDARTLNLLLNRNAAKGGVLNLTGTYRNLIITDSSESDQTLQGRIDHSTYLLKKLVRSTTFYQIGTGREQRREFNFFEVQPGNGVYVWNDYDSNGIKGLNEFEIASDLDRPRANYIRVFVPVPGFINTNTNQFNQSLFIQPASLIGQNKKGIPGFVARFSNLTALRVDRKITGEQLGDVLNPFRNDVGDSNLISTASNLRNVFYFNRSHATFGVDWEWQDNRNKGQLVNGFESRTQQFHRIRSRWNISRNWDLSNTLEWGEKSYVSEFFLNRNYRYDYLKKEMQIAYQYQSIWRISLLYEYFNGNNAAIYGGQNSIEHKIGTDWRWSTPSKGTLNASFQYVGVRFTGDANSAVAYELLRGLQDGNNFVWTLNIQRQISKSIQLSAQYDGRKSENSDVIHIGRVQARYLF